MEYPTMEARESQPWTDDCVDVGISISTDVPASATIHWSADPLP